MIGDIPGFRRALLGHFDRSRRALPWRSERTPYRVMVSEFMLQQTRVETVIPYYERWLRRFPGWEALAEAGEDEVLREWTGLGYYRRARNLHRAARVVRERFGGELPKEPAALKRLPGVGEYTAGAVASIAFGQAVPAVDGNVRRVLCRILDVAAPTASRLREEAARLVDPGRPGDFNEALMELGATVCTPRAPGCGGCPVRGWCGARGAGTVDERPERRPRREVARVGYGVAVVVGGGPSSTVTLLRKRPESGLLAGMWEFPSIELSGDEKPGDVRIAAAANRLLKHLGVPAHPTTPLRPIRHAFTHLHATYHPNICMPHPPTPCNPPTTSRLPHPTPPIPPTTPRISHPTPPAPHPTPLPIPPHAADNGADLPPTPTWVPLAHLNEYPLPVAQQKIAAQLRAWLRDNLPRASG